MDHQTFFPSQTQKNKPSHRAGITMVGGSASNNSQPLAIFQPLLAFSQPKYILIDQISCTFLMEQ